jgi:hypothetical protein
MNMAFWLGESVVACALVGMGVLWDDIVGYPDVTSHNTPQYQATSVSA